MVTVEILYDSSLDTATPDIADDLKKTFGGKVTVTLIDTATQETPARYGIVNPPEAIISGNTRIKLEGADSVKKIVSKVIF